MGNPFYLSWFVRGALARQRNAKYFLLAQAFVAYQRIFLGSTYSRQETLRHSILVTKKELLETSAQDQFAKWAKLRRKVDKELADLEKISAFS